MDRLVPFRDSPASSGLFLDFDGTLSEIVPVPSAARPVEGAVELLRELGRKLRVVAVVSGRRADELLAWLGPEVEIWGLHGAERTQDGDLVLANEVVPFVGAIAQAREQIEARLKRSPVEGIFVEDKGSMLGLHYRNASDAELARSAVLAIAREVAAAHGLVVVEGRMVAEIRPPLEFSKGKVVLERARTEDLRAAAFVGDDLVDLPGYEALDELEREGIATARVAVASAESPNELLARADIVVDGPRGVLGLLRSFV